MPGGLIVVVDEQGEREVDRGQTLPTPTPPPPPPPPHSLCSGPREYSTCSSSKLSGENKQVTRQKDRGCRGRILRVLR